METTVTEILGTANQSIDVPTLLVPVIMTVITTILGGVTYGVKRFIDYLIGKMEASDKEVQALNAVMDSIVEIEHTLVADLKAASEDGKLTKDEIDAIEAKVMSSVQSTASGPVLDTITSWGERRLKAIIKQLVVRIKG